MVGYGCGRRVEATLLGLKWDGMEWAEKSSWTALNNSMVLIFGVGSQ